MKLEFDHSSPVIKITGEIQIENIEQLRAPLAHCISERTDILVDLSGIEVFDTAAVQVLLSGQKTAASMNKPFRFQIVSDVVRQTCSALGVRLPLTGPDDVNGSPAV